MSLKEESEKLPLAEKDGRGVGQGLRNAGICLLVGWGQAGAQFWRICVLADNQKCKQAFLSSEETQPWKLAHRSHLKS